MVVKALKMFIMKGQKLPKTVIKIMGFSPSPNHKIANGSMEMEGIGLKIETVMSITPRNFFDWAADAPSVKARMQLADKPERRSLRVLHVACNSLSAFQTIYVRVIVTEGKTKLENMPDRAIISQMINTVTMKSILEKKGEMLLIFILSGLMLVETAYRLNLVFAL